MLQVTSATAGLRSECLSALCSSLADMLHCLLGAGRTKGAEGFHCTKREALQANSVSCLFS